MAEAKRGVTQAMRLVDFFDVTDVAKSRDWRSKLRVLLSLRAPEVSSLINGKRPPANDASSAVERAWTKAQTELFPLLELITSGPVQSIIAQFEQEAYESDNGEDTSVGTTVSGDGCTAWKAPKTKYFGRTKDAIRATTRS